MSSTASEAYSADEQAALLQVALASIQSGLDTGSPLQVHPDDYPPALSAMRASFVTLKRGGDLRGCIGSLTPVTSLVEDVAHNAFAAAFRDPRFVPLTAAELQDLEIAISVLGPTEPIAFSSEQDLLGKLRPGIDGLVLQDGRNRGTFLPAVWESLPQPADFLDHLKQKAGLPASYWSDTLEIQRYTTVSFAADVAGIRLAQGEPVSAG
ncbi:MAG: AmmeMemoRadiSam system protein A [Gammaproteobacteria bacterium]|jgi:AmmeMemoRadiSam system protein A